MKTYIKFISVIFFKSLLYIFSIMFCLVFILNFLSELDFFKKINIDNFFLIYLSFLNTPSLVFEIFPFIFLISTQLCFLNLIKDNQIEIFKYNGLLNIKILNILSTLAFFLGILVIILFYNFSSNLKKVYLEIKSNYTEDDKYLAVITKNGLWIKDIVENKIIITNSKKIENNYLIESFVSEFDSNYEPIRNISSKKIDIKDNQWLIYDAIIFENDKKSILDKIEINTNFNQKKIQGLFSNLSSLTILKLIELKKNYVSLNYSTTEVDIQIHRLISYPFYLLLITMFSGIVMFKFKKFQSILFKISIGLFFSVIIYYFNNFFNVLGKTEKIQLHLSIWLPLIILFTTNIIMVRKINEK